MAKAAKKAKPTAPKGPKKERKPREKKADAAAPAKMPASAIGHNLGVDPDKRELFLSDLRKWQALDKAAKSASAKRRAFEKEIKSDGFLLDQIHLADKLGTPEGEEEFRMHTANMLIAAQYVGAEIGTQLSLFLEPSRVPAVDLAYDSGVQDSIEGKTAKPGFDPSTEQFRRYMAGYNDETERRIKKGIGSDVKPNPKREDVLAAAREANELPVPPAAKFN